jgi:hypothetical protein
MRNKRFAWVALVGILFTAACQDLEITNPNAPDRSRAITEPGDVETLVYGSWPLYLSRTHRSSSCYNAMPVIADEGTTTYANNAALELSSEPRVPFNNNPLSDAHGIARYQWYDWYEMLSNVNDALVALDGGMRIEDQNGDRTDQVRAFAKFLQGISLGWIGALFDRGIVATEDSDLENPETLEFKTYSEVLEQAVASLEEAADLAQGGSWAIEGVWEGRTITPSLLQEVAHSYIAKFMVYGARSVDERDALDWNKVLTHLDQGLQDEDFYLEMSPTGTRSFYRYRIQSNGSFSQRADYYLIGPADVSGNFQSWLATPLEDRVKFHITTPDRRITGADSATDGKYFEYKTDEVFRPERGTYHFSYYQFDRYGGEYRYGPLALISLDELRLIRAEAALRTGNRALAAELANVTRTQNGELPPVTADGVQPGPSCVPRMSDGQCGDLEYAIHYERMIEGVGISCLRGFMDRRGFGSLTPGTFIHFPVPARELETLGQPIYTFGGVGQEGAAPAWRW